jgi:hypothetical protein
MSIALTLAVLCTWALIGVGFCAIGVLFHNRLGELEITWRHAFYAVWTGFALLIASLMLWHFFLPVNETALFVFAGLAVLSLVIERRWFASALRLPVSRFFAVIIIVFAIWTANHSLGNGGYDDYLYEFQAIRWFHDYPIVPGLANLHTRLGYNNSHHLLAALLSTGLWSGAVNHILNGFFIVLACAFFLGSVRDLAIKTREPLGLSLFSALLVCPCVGLVSSGYIGSIVSALKADVIVAAATAVLACLFLRWTASPPANQAALTATILVVGGVIPTIKLSGLVFCGIIVATVAFRSRGRLASGAPGRKVITGALVAAVVLAVAAPVRGVILSGYPFYPLDSLRFDVDWRVPTAQVQADRVFIRDFARDQATAEQMHADSLRLAAAGGTDAAPAKPAVPSGSLWIREWARRTADDDPISIVLPLILTLACLPLLLVRGGDVPRDGLDGDPPGWAYATLALGSVSALIVWFIQAPAPRFAIVDVWILFASVFAWAIQKQCGGWNWNAAIAAMIGLACSLAVAALVLLYFLRLSNHMRPILTLLSFAALWIVLFGISLGVRRPVALAVLCLLPALFQYGERSVTYVRSGNYRAAASMAWLNISRLRPPVPPTPVVRETRSGLAIYVMPWLPTLFETPIPNTMYFDPFLQLRTVRMKDGFRVVWDEDRVSR